MKDELKRKGRGKEGGTFKLITGAAAYSTGRPNRRKSSKMHFYPENKIFKIRQKMAFLVPSRHKQPGEKEAAG